MFSYQKYQESGIPALLRSVVVVGLLFLIGSCDSSESQNRFTITADIEGLEAQTAVLRYNRLEGKPVTLDSSSVDNGSFSFEGTLDSPREVTVWTKPDNVIFKFYADNGKINVTGNVEDAQMVGGSAKMLNNVDVTGSAIHNEAEAYKEKMAAVEKKAEPYRKAYSEANQKLSSAKQSGVSQEKIDRLEKKAWAAKKELDEATSESGREEITARYIRNHPNSHFAVSLFVRRTNNHTYQENKEIFDNFSQEVQNGFYGRKVKAKLEELKKASPGAQAAGFTATDINGKELSLKDFRGQYVLLDFWASWCKPCRAYHPQLLKLYEKYNEQGFEIIGIADDDRNPQAWRKAIKEDGVGVWRHVLRGLEYKEDSYEVIDPGISAGYAIETLPTKILVNPEGKIIGRYGGGGKNKEALEQKLKQIFEG